MPQVCPQCAAPLAPGAKFCANCGHRVAPAGPVPAADASATATTPGRAPAATAPLSAAAPAPSTPAADPSARLRQYIPKELLGRLESAAAGKGMLGERRIVTMLFCDVKGSTAAAERLDPEEWADIMNGAFAHLIAPVYRYEGTLARLMGDAILAFFGAPLAHEDDPQRAVLAGLAIVAEIGPYRQKVKRDFGIDFDVRVGINTGLVVVGEVGSDLRLEYTAMGDAVNLAARMEQAATPGTVLVAEATHKLVAPLFDTEDRGLLELKGKQEAVRAFRVKGAKAAPGRLRGVQGLESPMVGRDRELAVLRGQVDALRRGSGHIVSVIAEAGLGKSRLVAELQKTLAAEGVLSELAWYEGRTLSYQSATPFAPVVDLLKSLIGLRPGASGGGSPEGAPAYAAILAAVAAGVGDAGAATIAPFIGSLLGAPLEGDAAERVRYLEGPALAGKITLAVVDLIAGLSARRPHVIVFEDLHWADSSSLQVLERLLGVADQQALLLVPVFRPRPQEASWRIHEVAAREHLHRYVPLTLEPLGEDDTRALVANLLRIEGITETVRALILRKAEGNPYFVEEVIRSLIDQGVIERQGEHWRATRDLETIAIPDNLAAVLSARLDHLDELSRRVAQIAAVIGREFPFDALASLITPLDAVEGALSDLQRRGLVRERARLPKRLYWFKHVLVQEAAYQSLLLKTRRELHRQIGDVLVRIAPEEPAPIARHFLEARDGARALPHLVAAAERAARAYSLPEALRLFEQALELLDASAAAGPAALASTDRAFVTRVFEGRGAALQLAMDLPRAVANWRAMIARATALGDDVMRASGLNKLASVEGIYLGNLAEGVRLLDEAEAASQGPTGMGGIIEGCMVRCAIHLGRAEFERASQYLDRAAEMGQAVQAEGPLLFGLSHVANAAIHMTEYDRAWPRIQAAMAKAEEYGNRKFICEIGVGALAPYQLREGDVVGAEATLRRSIDIARHIGMADNLCVGAAQLGHLLTLQGRHEEAMALNEEAVAAGRAGAPPFMASLALCTLGTSYVHVSERLHDKARAAHLAALEMMNTPLGAWFGAMNWCEVAFCALQIGSLDRARELFHMGLTTPTPLMHEYRPRLLVGAALVALRDGRHEDARGALAEARAFAETRKMRNEYPHIRLGEARLHAALREPDRALPLFAEAAALGAGLSFRPTVFAAHAEAAALLAATGASEAAERERTAARAVADEMAAFFKDADQRAQFQALSARQVGASASIGGASP
jgi:class 3 adenylate cyclase/tetratricopeptide (TPR) repeat protein